MNDFLEDTTYRENDRSLVRNLDITDESITSNNICKTEENPVEETKETKEVLVNQKKSLWIKHTELYL